MSHRDDFGFRDTPYLIGGGILVFVIVVIAWGVR